MIGDRDKIENCGSLIVDQQVGVDASNDDSGKLTFVSVLLTAK